MTCQKALWSRFSKNLARFFAGRGAGVAGVAAIEFAVVAGALVLLMVAAIDFGMGFYRKMQVETAAQAGAQYAAVHGFSAGSISSAVTAATSFSGISASPAPSQYCGCPSNSGVTTISCSSICGDGSAPGGYVAVAAQGVYTPIIAYPMLPSSFTFTTQATVRIQ